MKTAVRSACLCLLALSISMGGLLAPAAGVVSAAEQLHECCNTGTPISDYCVGWDQALAQSFIALSDHTVTRVGLCFANSMTAGTKTVDVSIVACDASHLPIGTTMTSASLDVPETGTSPVWVYVDVPPCNLAEGVEYAVVAYRAPHDCVIWWTVDEAEFVEGGPGHISTRTSSGGTWGLYLSGKAFPFEIWGTEGALHEYFDEVGTGGSDCIGGDQRVVQTFTAASAHAVSEVWLYADNYGGTQSLTASVMACGSSNPDDPSWTVLSSATVEVATTDGYEWIKVDGLSGDLTGGQSYAIVAEGPSGCIAWRTVVTDGTWSSPGSPGVRWLYTSEGWDERTDITLLFRVFGASSAGVSIDLVTGWNMVSVPVEADDMSVDAVFPQAEAVYTWNPTTKSYVTPTTIEPELSYWVAVTSDDTITVTGTPVTEWTYGLTTGWNMAGSVYGDPVDVADLVDDPSGSVQTNAIYHWNPLTKSYVAATRIEQSLGYWAATTADCELTLSPPT